MIELLKILKGLDPALVSKLIAAFTKMQSLAGEMKLDIKADGEGRESLCVATTIDGQPATLTLAYPASARQTLGL